MGEQFQILLYEIHVECSYRLVLSPADNLVQLSRRTHQPTAKSPFRHRFTQMEKE